MDLSGKQCTLDKSEKEEMLKEYCVKYGVTVCEGDDSNSQLGSQEQKLLRKNTFDSIVKSQPLIGFPQACYVFFSDPNIFKLGIDYFVHADRELQAEIRTLRKRDSLKYLLLAYTLLENRKIDMAALNRKKLQTICDRLQLCLPEDVDLQDEMDEMEHTYFRHVMNLQYEYRHETYLEAVLLSVATAYPETVLKNADEKIILEYVRSFGYKPTPGEICVCLPSSFTKDLAQKFLRMYRSGNFYKCNYVSDKYYESISALDTMTDSNFVEILLEELRCRMDVLHFSHCFFVPACKYERYYFVEHCLRIAEICKEHPSMHEDPMLTNEHLNREEPIPVLRLLDRSLHLGFAESLERGNTKTTKAILDSQHFGINRKFDIKFGVEVNCQGERIGKTPILYAAFIGCKESIEFLLDYPDVDLTITDSTNSSLLHYCVAAGWVDIVKKIIRKHAYLLQSKNSRNVTPLHFAFLFAKPQILEILFEFNIVSRAIFSDRCYTDLSLIGLIYCTVVKVDQSLHKGVFGSEIYIHVKPVSLEDDFVKLFQLIYTANKKCVFNVALDVFENSLSHYCVMNNLSKVLEYFLSHFPSVLRGRNKTELPTCLHTAVFLGRSEMAKKLMAAGVNLQEGDMDLRTTLSLGQKEVTRSMRHNVYPPYPRVIRYECHYGLWRKCNPWDGVAIRFGEPEQYREIEEMLQERA